MPSPFLYKEKSRNGGRGRGCMRKYDWIFFDLGSTLLDETGALALRARDMIAGTNITPEAYEQKRQELCRQGIDGNEAVIHFFGLKKTPWHPEGETLFPDTVETLTYLKQKGYKLGIIANQVPGTKKRLKERGLLDFFDVVAASAEAGVSKPDPNLFLLALQEAHCTPEKALMAGDRVDNDILPAKMLGMGTLWVRRGMAAFQPGSLGEGMADHIVDTLAEMRVLL